jgi:hypothetical protein
VGLARAESECIKYPHGEASAEAQEGEPSLGGGWHQG